MMDMKTLGNTGVQVSELCFGTMSFGGDADEEMSGKLYKRCRDAGINFFDCANIYVGGRSEEILGKLMVGERQDLVITSKVYFPAGKDVNARGASRRHIMQEIEKSLKRLQTDWIDVYFIHHFDELTPLEETMRALDDLVRQGKILYPALSNHAAWQIMKAQGIAIREALSKVAVIQPMYNLVKRQAEVEILPMALSENIAVIPYSPLGGGLLTGKYGLDKSKGSGRLKDNKMYDMRYGEEWMFQAAVDFVNLAKEKGYDPAALAVAWVGAHPAVTAPIIGARNLPQLEGSLKSVDIDMTAELYRSIAALTPDPAIATDRSEERKGTDWY